MPFCNEIATQSLTFLAYLDPGMGSMQFQILVAGLLSASIFLKSSYGQFCGWAGRFFKKTI